MGSEYPPKSTCYYWFRKLLDKGIFSLIFDELIGLLEKMEQINLSETYIDATFIRSKAGKQLVGKTNVAKVINSWLCAMINPDPWHCFWQMPLVLKLNLSRIRFIVWQLTKPQRIIGDKAYDSDKQDAELKEQGIDLIAPNRSNRKHNFQDKRPPRRYKRRHKIENFFAHLHNYRRTLISHDKYPHTFFGFILFASIIIILNKIK